MLLFFPSPYDDEALYSMVARYCRLSGNLRWGHSSVDLFDASVAPSVDFGSRLARLCSKLQPESLLTPDRLIKWHTLYPLYKPFLPEQRAVKLARLMRGTSNASSIQKVSGALQGNAKRPRSPRYCLQCAINDERTYGEPYWHRSHQAHGVHLCHKHGSWLAEYRLDESRSNRQIGPVCLDLDLGLTEGTAWAADWREHQRYIADAVCWILNNPCKSVTGGIRLRRKYLHLIRENGFASELGRVRTGELVEAVSSFYGPAFLHKMNCSIDRNKADNWVTDILWRTGKAVYPIRHVLFMRFLGATAEEFYALDGTEYSPFGRGPWPCLNPAAGHYKEKVVAACDITRNNNTKKPVGKFTCSCGFAYLRCGPERDADDIYRLDQVVSYGATWDSELLRLSGTGRCSLRKIGRMLGVCHHTVRNRLAELQGQKVLTYDQPVTTVGSNRREQARKAIEGMIRANPGISRSRVRAALVADYTWLDRNDSEWLAAHLPGRRPATLNFKPRVNWLARDDIMSEEIKAAADQILSLPGKPVRITTTGIGRVIGQRSLSAKNLERLPKTKAAIEEVLETLEEFQVRRVQRVIKVLTDQGEPLRRWMIIQRAGLNGRCSDRVSEEIDKAFSLGAPGASQLGFPFGGRSWQLDEGDQR